RRQSLVHSGVAKVAVAVDRRRMKTPRGRFLPFGKSTEGSVSGAPVYCPSVNDPYKNEWSLRTKESYKQKSTRVLLRKTASASFDGDGFLSEDQREAIEHFNRKLVPLGWLPVTKVSDELSKAIEVFGADDVRRLVDAVVAGRKSLPKRKTLVRLIWSNY